MDLRSIANAGASVVNANIIVTVLRSTGQAIVNHKQAPTYADPVTGLANIQAMTERDLRQVENMNLQGTVRAIYFKGPLAAIVRPESKGGDLVQFDGQTWLVVQVLEAWDTWTKAAITLQGSGT